MTAASASTSTGVGRHVSFRDYEGRRVVVTGCSSGIGQATAQALVELGAVVHGLAREEVGAPAGLTSYRPFDLGSPESIESAAASIGAVDALFNCAGAPPMAPTLDVLRVNFLGTRLLTDLIVDQMAPGGAVVSTSSDGGSAWRTRLPLLLDFLAVDTFEGGLAWYEEHQDEAGHAYSFGKQALIVWTLLESRTLIQRGIRINTTSPGAVQTPMLEAIEQAFPRDLVAATEQPIGRRSTPKEQAGPLLFLNSAMASYVNGADLPVDGGYRASLAVMGKLWS